MAAALPPAAMAEVHAAAFTGSRAWRADEFAALLAQPGCFATGDTACFAVARVVADEAELLTIATLPECRRRGLARACMTAWMAQAGARGAAHGFLEVAADNAPALALYAAMGFVRSGLRRQYYPRSDGPATDAVLMSRALPPGQPTES